MKLLPCWNMDFGITQIIVPQPWLLKMAPKQNISYHLQDESGDFYFVVIAAFLAFHPNYLLLEDKVNLVYELHRERKQFQYSPSSNLRPDFSLTLGPQNCFQKSATVNQFLPFFEMQIYLKTSCQFYCLRLSQGLEKVSGMLEPQLPVSKLAQESKFMGHVFLNYKTSS